MAKTKATETKANAVKSAPVVAATKAVGAAKKPEEKKPEVKPIAKAEDKKPVVKAEKKPAAKKPAKKTTTKRASKKPVEKIQEIYVEYGDPFQVETIVDKIHEAYRADGHRVGAIKSLRVYINPVERKAYYVINDKAEDKFVEF